MELQRGWQEDLAAVAAQEVIERDPLDHNVHFAFRDEVGKGDLGYVQDEEHGLYTTEEEPQEVFFLEDVVGEADSGFVGGEFLENSGREYRLGGGNRKEPEK